MRPITRWRLFLGILLALLLSTRIQGQGPLTAQIENFWRLISTGGRTFQTLRAVNVVVTGTCTGCSAGFPLLAPNGTAGAPSYSFSAESGLGWYRPSAGQMGLSSGALVIPNGTTTTPALFFVGSATNTGFHKDTATNGLMWAASNANAWGYYSANINFSLGSGVALGWAAGSDADQAADLLLFRDTSGTLAQRNGTNTQTFNIYSTSTDASNFIKTVVGRSPFFGSGQGITVEGLGTGANPNFIIGTRGTGTIAVAPNGATTWVWDSTGAVTTMKGTTAGVLGIPVVRAQARTVAAVNTGTASAATFTVGASDGTFEVGCNVLVTTSTTHSFSCDTTYTDESNTARTMVMPVEQLAGTFATSGLITNATGAGPYESAVMTIRAKASTAITIRTSAGGTFTTVTYNIDGTIKQVG